MISSPSRVSTYTPEVPRNNSPSKLQPRRRAGRSRPARMTSTADPFASTRTAAGLPSVRWECVSCADGSSIAGEVAENAGRQVLHGRGLKVTLEGRIIAGLWTHGRLRGCGVVLNAADELTCSETWLQQPGGSLRTEGTSETFPLRPALASPEAHALQSALATVLRLAGSLRHQAMALEASGSCWAVEVEEDTREVLRLVLSRYGVHMRTCTAVSPALLGEEVVHHGQVARLGI